MGDPPHVDLKPSPAEHLRVLLCESLEKHELLDVAHEVGQSDRDLLHYMPQSTVGRMARYLADAAIRRNAVKQLLEELAHRRPNRRREIQRIADEFAVDVDWPVHELSLTQATPRRRHGLLTIGVVVGAIGMAAVCVEFLVTKPPPPRNVAIDRGFKQLDVKPGAAVEHQAKAGPRCTRSGLHAGTTESLVALHFKSDKSPELALDLSFSREVDAGVVAKHAVLEHMLDLTAEERALFEDGTFELCIDGHCFGHGDTVGRLIPQPTGRVAGASRRADAGPRTTSQSLGTRTTARSGSGGSVAAPVPVSRDEVAVPTVAFIRLQTMRFARARGRPTERTCEARVVAACEGWDAPCARVAALPGDFGSGEFSLRLRVQLARPQGVRSDEVAEPYAHAAWWTVEPRILDGIDPACTTCGGFALTYTGDGGLRWLIGDGTDVGPGGLWSIDGHPQDGEIDDGAWHDVVLVRRWSGDDEAMLELWIDGSLAGAERLASRADLRAWWVDADGGLRRPWIWQFAGTLGEVHIVEEAAEEAVIAGMACTDAG